MKKTLFWIIAGFGLTSYFTILGNSFIQTFYFVSFLLPIAVGTAYIMNEVIVPKYYITKRLFYFSLYTVYLFIISLFFQNLIIILSIVIFESFQKEGYNNLTVNIVNLNLLFYVLILINGFLHLLVLAGQKNVMIESLEKRLSQNDNRIIHVRYNRQNYPIIENDILYIESLSDYLKIVTTKDEIVTKKTMTGIEKELSDSFIRIHRSFIINKGFVSSYNKEFVSLNDIQLPISRTYKKRVIELMSLLT